MPRTTGQKVPSSGVQCALCAYFRLAGADYSLVNPIVSATSTGVGRTATLAPSRSRSGGSAPVSERPDEGTTDRRSDDRPRPSEERVRPPAPTVLVSVIIPTYNEAGNVAILLDRLAAALAGRSYEIIVVDDDSADRTWAVAEAHRGDDQRVAVIRRIGERGLSSAVMAGMAAATGRALVVMDADLQHDETKVLSLVSEVIENGVDVCVGSRHAQGGGYGAFGRRRRLVSWTGTALARGLLGVVVSDPMSGFFAVSRDRYELVSDQINPRGFKILLEFLARGAEPTVCEVGYQFGERVNGSTKLSGSVVLDYLRALTALTMSRLRRRPLPGTRYLRSTTDD